MKVENEIMIVVNDVLAAGRMGDDQIFVNAIVRQDRGNAKKEGDQNVRADQMVIASEVRELIIRVLIGTIVADKADLG
jgi:hypothetical protein